MVDTNDLDAIPGHKVAVRKCAYYTTGFQNFKTGTVSGPLGPGLFLVSIVDAVSAN